MVPFHVAMWEGIREKAESFGPGKRLRGSKYTLYIPLTKKRTTNCVSKLEDS